MRTYYTIEEQNEQGNWKQLYHDYEVVYSFDTLEEAVKRCESMHLAHSHFSIKLRVVRVTCDPLVFIGD
jgi:hypothetical protein